ncbi:MAG: PKD domain-containing protein [Chloroflexota bacterium]
MSPQLRRPRLTRPAVLMGLVVVAALVVAIVQITVAQANVLARDTFGRTSSSGWGSAEVGGAWTNTATTANYTVGGGLGRMVIPTKGATRSVSLGGVAATDVDVLVQVSSDTAASGGGLFFYAEGRYVDNNTQYRGKIRLASGGAVFVGASRMVGGSQAAIGAESLVAGLTYTPGAPLWVRAQFTGTSPTTIRVKAWTGATEPTGWNYTGTDSTAALQVAGQVGLRTYLSSNVTSVPVNVTWDELTVTDPSLPPPIVAPTADFTVSCSALSCSFSDSSAGFPTAWNWNFGDGATASTKDATHVYAGPGPFTVTLTVSNGAGSDQHQEAVVVTADPAEPWVTDSFARSAASGWGSADLGGAYRLLGATSGYSVASDMGVMTMPVGATRAAWLDLTERDVDLRFQVSLDVAPSGNGTYIYGLVRRVDAQTAYRPKLRFASDGSVWLHASVVVGGVETSLAPAMRASDVVATAGQPLMVRMRVVGADPTMIRVKVWAATVPEPADWGFSVTDDTSALQRAGAAGVQAYQSSGTTGQQRARFDDLWIGPAPAPVQGPTAELSGAGDIASCASNGDEGTATLLDAIGGTVFAAGDLVYQDGTPTEFANCYDPSWGRHRDRTLPVPGNHEYNTDGAAGYFGYFGQLAGDPERGFYATSVGNWRVYVLNSECGRVHGCGAGSPQETWLRKDLAANLTPCALAIMHRPRFSSGEHGNDTSVQGLWQALQDARVELVISGHDHDYERFAPQTATGVASARGVTQFVVGTGGIALRPIVAPRANSEVRQATSRGVLRLSLEDRSYNWTFQRSDGPAFVDNGSVACH